MIENNNSDIWEKVRLYLQKVDNTNQDNSNILNDEKKLLKDRAKDIAKPIEILDEIPTFHVIEFSLSNEKYAIETSYVKEVLPVKDLMPIPFTPDFVLGVINIRGQIFSVLDLKKVLGVPEREEAKNDKVIIVSNNEMEFGIIADKIDGVSFVKYNSLQTSLSTLSNIQNEYLMGVTKERLIVLDIEKILSDKKIIVHDEI